MVITDMPSMLPLLYVSFKKTYSFVINGMIKLPSDMNHKEQGRET